MRMIAVVGVAAVAVVSAVPAAAEPTVARVVMANYAFTPATITVSAGSTVVWTNTDQAPHDVTTTSAPVAIHSATMTKGQSWSYTFTTPGTYQYICSVHPDMRATVVVRAAPAAATSVQQASASPRAVVAAGPATPAVARRTPAPRNTPTVRARVQAPAAVSTAPTIATATAVPASTAPSLRPLLLVAGLVAAIATFCLLLLASVPDGRRRTGA